jgi:plasmid maintenance system antidote protein VapI
VQSFSELLNQYLDQPGTKQSVVAERAGVDPGTITKLKKGQGTTRDTVLRLAKALGLSAYESDRLLASAQYLPLSLAEAEDDVLETVLGVARLLTDERAPQIDRMTMQQFLALLVRLARHQEVISISGLHELARAPLDTH